MTGTQSQLADTADKAPAEADVVNVDLEGGQSAQVEGLEEIQPLKDARRLADHGGMVVDGEGDVLPGPPQHRCMPDA